MLREENTNLGRWAVIDLETTGLDPLRDSIIDIGFLQFEETKLINRYRSLVHLPSSDTVSLSHFIQKLTGITPEMLKDAPSWQKVQKDIKCLQGHTLLAHNASFEEAFLQKSFDEMNCSVRFEDSLVFLPLLFPHFPSFSLESFIQFFKIDTQEAHRGLEDSVDLLKVLIASIKYVRQDDELNTFLQQQFKKYQLEDYWYSRFFFLQDDKLEQIAQQLDFDWKNSLIESSLVKKESSPQSKSFSLDFSGENIQKILQNSELIQEKIPSYKYRKTQEMMALKVGQSLKNNVHAIVQAPTGTGKTLGHLLPSALFALDTNEQVLITTGTKALQNQAMTKDIPQLRKILGLDENELRITQMVGSGNHFCESLFRQKLEKDPPLLS
ncbi:MAG: exonuclease domain-containing protein, partial [Halobacteriovoraceae bacterium]|nr:exonuclease domain-containing protein [Halobacteriovoraceae bacterium]